MRINTRFWTAAAAIGMAACGSDSGPAGPGDTFDAPQIDASLQTLVRDKFNRVSNFGWGATEIGGAWMMSQPAHFSVDGQNGIVTLDSSRPENVVLDGGFGVNVAGITRFKVDRAPDDSEFHTLQVYIRRDDSTSDGNNYYRLRVRMFERHQFGRHMDIRLEKNVEAHASFVTPIINLGARFAVDRWYWLRWEAVGTDPTRIRARVWENGSTQPDRWDIDVTDAEPRLTVAGRSGYRIQGPSRHESWPVRYYFGELHVAEIAAH